MDNTSGYENIKMDLMFGYEFMARYEYRRITRMYIPFLYRCIHIDRGL